MTKRQVIATVLVVAAAATYWATRATVRPPATSADTAASDSAYDYEARDVVVRQMGQDGALKYELAARQIAQLPHNGEISATDLVMYYDPSDNPSGSANRWRLTADHALLPESGAAITLQGKVTARGVPQNSQGQITVATEQLIYNLDTQEVSSHLPVDFSWGSSRFQSGDLRLNIKLGTYSVESGANGTIAP